MLLPSGRLRVVHEHDVMSWGRARLFVSLRRQLAGVVRSGELVCYRVAYWRCAVINDYESPEVCVSNVRLALGICGHLLVTFWA